MAVTGLTDSLYAGNPRELRFTVIDQDTPPGNLPKDLSGISARWALARYGATGDPIVGSPLIDKDTARGSSEIQITDAVNGKLSVFLLAGDTSGLGIGDYYMELELYITATPFTLVVATGTLTILPNVVNT